MKRAAWVLGGVGLALCSAVLAEECIDLLYFERAPYYQLEPDGRVGGLVAGRVEEAFAAAGLCRRWVALPAARHLLEIERNRRAACAVGWFRTAQRERIGRFSAPLYRDRPLVAVAAARLGLKDRYPAAADLLSRPDLVLGVRAGFSYGARLDAEIARLRPRTYRSSRATTQLLSMVEHGRVDYVFMGREEADHLLAARTRVGLQRITFGGLPGGNRRHLLCSARTPDDAMRRLDAAIRERWPG